MTVSFAVQLFSLFIVSLFLLDAEPLEAYLGTCSLCLYVPVYFLLLPVIVSKFQVLQPLQQMLLGKTVIHLQKSETRSMFITLY
jgi:hypothetical protein